MEKSNNYSFLKDKDITSYLYLFSIVTTLDRFSIFLIFIYFYIDLISYLLSLLTYNFAY
jgi:hypothetical protein